MKSAFKSVPIKWMDKDTRKTFVKNVGMFCFDRFAFSKNYSDLVEPFGATDLNSGMGIKTFNSFGEARRFAEYLERRFPKDRLPIENLDLMRKLVREFK